MKNFFPRLIVVLVGIVGCALIAFGSGHLGFPGTCVLAAGFVYCVIVGNIWATVRAGAKYRELRPGGLGHVFAVGGAILISSGFFLGNDVEIIASFVAGVLAVWIANASLTRVQKKTFQKSDYKNKIRALRDAQKMAVITGKTKPMETPEEREESVVKAGDRIRTRWDHKFFLDVLNAKVFVYSYQIVCEFGDGLMIPLLDCRSKDQIVNWGIQLTEALQKHGISRVGRGSIAEESVVRHFVCIVSEAHALLERNEGSFRNDIYSEREIKEMSRKILAASKKRD